MCGIFGVLNNRGLLSHQYVQRQFEKSAKRGPEYSSLTNFDDSTTIGFHRLAINGLDEKSHQPICKDKIAVVCNGEIYNYKALYKLLNVTPETNSDCEVILHMYRKYGIEYTLSQLDGVFAIALFDFSKNEFFLARDPYGVRPLFYAADKENISGSLVAFASTLQSVVSFRKNFERLECHPFQPGTYSKYYLDDYQTWKFDCSNRYTVPGVMTMHTITTEEEALYNIQKHLSDAVKKRVETTDRPIACLLSGGLDSSLITSLVKKHYAGTLETYSIGLPGSEDCKYAQMVADHLGTKHTQITMSEEEFFEAIPTVIENIESYDTTTVRASVGNYLIGKYISENSEAKVIFNGDGSDELTGGYMYFHCAPDMLEFDRECKRLLSNISFFDVLRSDRSISSHGLEPRTPFLDRGFVQFYLSLPPALRFHKREGKCEKYLLRKAFAETGLLPDNVLWRTKEAFSDGVSSLKKSWYSIIDEQIIKQHSTSFDTIQPGSGWTHNVPITREQIYYRSIFDKHYKGCANVIPYFWMPKYTNAKDSSARTLEIYKEKSSL